ncbi:MAG: AMP-binding protein [Hyphomicrobiaceae bacterium]
MIEVEGQTIGKRFNDSVRRYASHPFLIVPRDPDRAYDRDGRMITFAEAGAAVDRYATLLSKAGYGYGHRIAVLLENRAENLLVKLACAKLGVSWVPVNPDYRPSEIAFLLRDSDAELAIATEARSELMAAGIRESGRSVPLSTFAPDIEVFAEARRPAPVSAPPHGLTEASLLYTSGTTGRPKGCILNHEYELMLGAWYTDCGGLFKIEEARERIYNPLPLFHVNAGIVSFYGALLTGNCQIIPERFGRTRWWPEIRETEATMIHYLGVVVPVILNEPPSPDDRRHKVRFGFGAGLEPTVHGVFEERFGFPLIEGWGMTEMCRILTASVEPRHIDTRAMGRPRDGLQIRVVDAEDRDVPIGEPGEMVVRHSAESPRKGAFSGYLNQPEATAEAWRNGWLHTGDTVRQDESGMLYFVDRKKNIIRRSGENIAAAEIEACLQGLDRVAQVAVLAIEDPLRDEEVLACIVLKKGAPNTEQARACFDHCYDNLAYYKAPGWIAFVDSLPVTGTQKVLKHMIFAEGEDPLSRPNTFDFREFKKRRR